MRALNVQGVLVKRLFFVVLMCAAVACSKTVTDTGTQTESTTTGTETAVAAADTSATTSAAPAATEEKPMSEYSDKVAVLQTSAGEIDIRFFPDVAPNHVKNFIDLAQKGFYNGTKFHRVIPGFMIQGGDPNTIKGDPATWGTGNSGKNVNAEFNAVPHRRGIVSMARSNDPNSASSQFFIVVKDSTFLDNQYTVFGQVTKGMDVADKIVSAPRGVNDRPNSPVSIDSITIRDANADEKGPAPK
jgi:cyclophilin family peptidyl-prolyl cis-trans isomerase